MKTLLVRNFESFSSTEVKSSDKTSTSCALFSSLMSDMTESVIFHVIPMASSILSADLCLGPIETNQSTVETN